MLKNLVIVIIIGSLALFPVIAYASLSVNVVPTTDDGYIPDGVQSVNLVFTINNDSEIDSSTLRIEFNGEDITAGILPVAASKSNRAKTRLSLYYPIKARKLLAGMYAVTAYVNGQPQHADLTIRTNPAQSTSVGPSKGDAPAVAGESVPASSPQNSNSPSVSKVYGESIWNYHNCWNKSSSPGTYIGYAQVPYKGRNDSGIGKIIAQGSNLDKVTSVTIQEGDYTVIGIQKIGTTQLKLDIRANYVGERYPIPVTNSKIVFTYSGGTITKTVNLIPTFYKDNQSWGQCTWYAGIVMRIKNNQSEVRSYSSTTAISGDPNSSGFPQKGSLLNASDAHMAYLEDITLSKTVKNSDGSTTYTYKLKGSQYNASCDVSKSSFSTAMVVKKSKTGTYSITTAPKVVYTVTKIKQ